MSYPYLTMGHGLVWCGCEGRWDCRQGRRVWMRFAAECTETAVGMVISLWLAEQVSVEVPIGCVIAEAAFGVRC